MTTGFQKMMESQQEMLEKWQEMTSQMWKPFWETASPRPSSDKKKKKAPQAAAGEAEWADNLSAFWQEWWSAMEKMTRQNWQTYREMTGAEGKGGSVFDVANMWKESARAWAGWMEKNWGQQSGDTPLAQWQKQYAEWGRQWFKMWETPLQMGSDRGLRLFPLANYQKSMFGILKSYPADQWCNFLSRYNEFLENYIHYVDDIDLPFDEMAAAWEKMLEAYKPKEDLPYSILGESMGKYMELFTYPLHGVVEPPKLISLLKTGYAIQFYTLSFLIRNAELRGMVLEASLAAWPEALQACSKEFENNGNAPSMVYFYEEFLNRLDDHLHKLMQSKDYVQVQEKIVESMVTLKSHLNKWFEAGMASLPLVTQSDLDDVAREIEALRVKIRKIDKIREPATVKEIKNGEVGSMN